MSEEEARLWRMFWLSCVKADAYSYLLRQSRDQHLVFRYRVAVNIGESATGAILALFIFGERNDYPT